MNLKTLVRLFAILVGMVVCAVVLRSFSKTAVDGALISKDAASRAGRMEVRGPQGSFVFVHSSGAWMMEQPMAYPADLERLPPLIEKLSKVQLSDELSRDPARYGTFGLHESSATQVRLDRWDDAAKTYVNEIHFQVGKDGSDYASMYLRFGGRPEVVLGQGVGAHEFARDLEYWLDKTIASVAQHEIKSLSVKTALGRVQLKQGDGKWLVHGKPVPQESFEGELKPVLDAVAHFVADRVLPAEMAAKLKTGLGSPEITIDIESTKGPVLIKVGAKDPSGQRFVERAGEKRVLFMVGDWKIEPFRKKEFIKINSSGGSS